MLFDQTLNRENEVCLKAQHSAQSLHSDGIESCVHHYPMQHGDYSNEGHSAHRIVEVHLVNIASFVVSAGPKFPFHEIIRDQEAGNLGNCKHENWIIMDNIQD